MLPNYIKGIVQIVIKSYKGSVTIVPSPSFNDYYNLFENVTPQNIGTAFWNTYVQSLGKMSRIRSYFAIEREFDRYYELLKRQLRDGSDFTDVRDQEEFELTASRTFDRTKAWENPLQKVPLEKSHLTLTAHDDPKIFEQLCVQHDTIRARAETKHVATTAEEATLA